MLALPPSGNPPPPARRGAPDPPSWAGTGMGHRNEINSLSKLLITAAEERALQLRQGCFIYILGTTDDDC